MWMSHVRFWNMEDDVNTGTVDADTDVGLGLVAGLDAVGSHTLRVQVSIVEQQICPEQE